MISISGCRIMANIPAFQASDASSILATRTKIWTTRVAFLIRESYNNRYAPVAQWIEQETSKLLAAGSIPARGTIGLMFLRRLFKYLPLFWYH